MKAKRGIKLVNCEQIRVPCIKQSVRSTTSSQLALSYFWKYVAKLRILIRARKNIKSHAVYLFKFSKFSDFSIAKQLNSFQFDSLSPDSKQFALIWFKNKQRKYQMPLLHPFAFAFEFKSIPGKKLFYSTLYFIGSSNAF